MAIVQRNSIAVSTQTVAVWEAYFNNLGSSLISTTATSNSLLIDIDGVATWKLGFDNSGYCRPNTMTFLGTTTSLNVIHGSANVPITLITCLSDNLFYLHSKDDTNRKIVIVYEKIGSDAFFGYAQNTAANPTYIDINSVNLYDVNSENLYKHESIIPYSAGIDRIDYMPNDVLLQGGLLAVEDPIFLTCSTVLRNSVYTFNRYNCYSVGDHTLILMDN